MSVDLVNLVFGHSQLTHLARIEGQKVKPDRTLRVSSKAIDQLRLDGLAIIYIIVRRTLMRTIAGKRLRMSVEDLSSALASLGMNMTSIGKQSRKRSASASSEASAKKKPRKAAEKEAKVVHMEVNEEPSTSPKKKTSAKKKKTPAKRKKPVEKEVSADDGNGGEASVSPDDSVKKKPKIPAKEKKPKTSAKKNKPKTSAKKKKP